MAYIKELLKKAAIQEHFTERSFWMPGFYSQANFLTTLFQDVSRKTFIPIEQLTMNFSLLKPGERIQPFEIADQMNIFYIYGLYLYGAEWDSKNETLIDIQSTGQIGSKLPIIQVKIEPMEAASSDQSSANEEEGMMTLSEKYNKFYKDTHFICPVYVNFMKNRIINFQSSEG